MFAIDRGDDLEAQLENRRFGPGHCDGVPVFPTLTK